MHHSPGEIQCLSVPMAAGTDQFMAMISFLGFSQNSCDAG